MAFTLKSETPLIMGVLNVTPDSFFDGGKFHQQEAAIAQAEKMVADGVDIIDVGGESTRPGADPVSLAEECARVIPVIESLSKRFVVPISIDTRHTEVMRRALDAGATMINDVNALKAPGAIELAAERQVPVCVMHMQGLPETMQQNPEYGDVVDEIFRYLQQRADACQSQGILRQQVYIDPGFGFGKTLNHNLQLLGQLSRFKSLGYGILVGLSRKSMLGKILNVETEDRLYGSLACALLSLLQGADIIRTHDVRETRDIVKVFNAVKPFWQMPGSHHEYA